jgi:hypothetical protein
VACRSILQSTCACAERPLRPAGLLLAVLLASGCLASAAQQPGQLDNTTVTLQGEVTNAVTGEPLARALVQIEGDAGAGALTASDGRYALPDVPLGPQVIAVRKPGFRDGPAASGPLVVDPEIGPAHTVWVAAQMPDVNFALTPTAAIRGAIELSTGDPAAGMVVNLARRTVQQGRSIWQLAATTKTNSDGAYRFAGLAEGDYIVSTDPAMDSDGAATVMAPGRGAAVARQGYAAVFYPDARQPSGAQRITLHPGDQADAELNLTLEPFHAVIATALLPASLKSGDGTYIAAVLDQSGRQLAYNAQYDSQTHTVQALLPDGTYTLMLTATGLGAGAQTMLGATDVSVAGHAVSGLRIPVAPLQSAPVQLNLQGSGAATNQNGLTAVMLSPATGWIDDGMMVAYATGSAPGPMKTATAQAGVYLVHAHPQQGWCESSFTAGGANLARERLLIGPSGGAASMQLTLRDDCARLTLHLPQELSLPAGGEEQFYTVYVVPSFDSTTDVEPITLRPSTGGTFALSNLIPGDYRVYTFAQPVRLEYRNPEVMAALPVDAQTVTLGPGAATDLTVEVPQP